MRLFPLLLILFIVTPLLELYILISVGEVIGALTTVLIVIFTAFLGAFLLRYQGVLTLQRVQETMAQGGMPAIALLEGLFLLVAGVLLLTPGFITDILGFLCLIPVVRKAIIHAGLLSYSGLDARNINTVQEEYQARQETPDFKPSRKTSYIIEGEIIEDSKNSKTDK